MIVSFRRTEPDDAADVTWLVWPKAQYYQQILWKICAYGVGVSVVLPRLFLGSKAEDVLYFRNDLQQENECATKALQKIRSHGRYNGMVQKSVQHY